MKFSSSCRTNCLRDDFSNHWIAVVFLFAYFNTHNLLWLNAPVVDDSGRIKLIPGVIWVARRTAYALWDGRRFLMLSLSFLLNLCLKFTNFKEAQITELSTKVDTSVPNIIILKACRSPGFLWHSLTIRSSQPSLLASFPDNIYFLLRVNEDKFLSVGQHW